MSESKYAVKKRTAKAIVPLDVQILERNHTLLLIGLASDIVRIEAMAAESKALTGTRNASRAEDRQAIANQLRQRLAKNNKTLLALFGTNDPKAIAEKGGAR